MRLCDLDLPNVDPRMLSVFSMKPDNDRPNFHGHVRETFFFAIFFPAITALFAVQGGEFKSIVVLCGRVENKRSSNETLCGMPTELSFFLEDVFVSWVFVNLNFDRYTFGPILTA